MLRLIAPLELFHISGSGERKVDEEKKMKLKKKKALFFASSSAIPKSEDFSCFGS